MTAVLRAEDVDIVLGGVPVVTGLTLEVGAGEIVALVGRNGAGKTTTLRSLAGLQRVATGRVLLDGEELQGRPAHAVAAMGCVLVLEGSRVFRNLTVETNLRLGAVRASRSEAARQLGEQYRRLPALAGRRDQLAGQLSGGEQALLALAQALMSGPRVLLLDEPSVGLDRGMVAWLLHELATLRDQGVSLLVAEQAVDGILGVADRAYVLNLGRIVAHGPAGTIRDDPVLRDAYLGRRRTGPRLS